MSSSATQQHKSVQYKWFALCFRIQTCCNHILSAAESFEGRRQHAQIQEFLSVLFSPQLILQFKEGVPMVLLLRKLYLYFTKDVEAVHYIPGGGGGGGASNFFQGGGSKC